MDPVRHIEQLFADHGSVVYDGARIEPVTALQHALQCAQLAEWAQAPSTLVAAALLHDIGHFFERTADDIDDRHEHRAEPFLRRWFGAAVAEPVRLHVEAKRCLVAVDRAYARSLTPASVHSLALQGGPMTPAQLESFQRQSHAGESLQLRRWDDLAKVPGRTTPSLAYYLALIEEVRSRDC